MAYGPLSVGSTSSLELVTDKTLTAENAAADAKAVGEALAGYLPLTGGKMQGEAVFCAGKGLTFGDASVRFVSGENALVAENGAAPLQLRKNGTTKSWLDADGAFHGSVEGKATTAGTADKTNSVAWDKVTSKPSIATKGLYSAGNGWLRFTDGTQFCWVQGTKGTTSTTWPVPFANTSYAVGYGTRAYRDLRYYIDPPTRTTTSVAVGGTARLWAIGRWK